MKQYIIISYLFVAIVQNSFAQTQSADKVLIELPSSTASKVELVCWGLSSNETDTLAMTLSNNVWSVAMENTDPGFYFYKFMVDGTPVCNTNPSNFFYSKNTYLNAFEVIAETDTFFVRENGPYGSFNRCIYWSDTANTYLNYIAYTPAGYNESNTEYKVLYLIADEADKETSWIYQGRLLAILDNAIANGIIEPIIVVLSSQNFTTENITLSNNLYESILINDLIPHVDSTFYTDNSATARAIAGNKSGGVKAWEIINNNNSIFRNVGMFSIPVSYDLNTISNERLSVLNFDLFFLGQGISDPNSVDVYQFYERLGLTINNHFYNESEGNYNWLVWRKNLFNMLDNLFE